MDEAALGVAMETDLPSPKTNRRKRLAMRVAAFVAAMAALVTAFWFTRPPELVWWMSPEIGKTGRHLHALVPNGWNNNAPKGGFRQHGDYRFFFGPMDHTPRWLKWLLRRTDDQARLSVYVGDNFGLYKSHLRLNVGALEVHHNPIPQQNQALRWIKSPDSNLTAIVLYTRTDRHAFNATYASICNSLWIE